MYQVTSFAGSRLATMVNTAVQMTQEEKMCACCAEDDPKLARVVQGIPVRVCGYECASKLLDYWRTGPKVLKYNHFTRMLRLALDKFLGI